MKRPRVEAEHELRSLCNVGPATLGDLFLIGVHSVADLAKRDPQEMFHALEKATGHKQNICMLDLFHAIVREGRTGERRPWHYYSALRRGAERK